MYQKHKDEVIDFVVEYIKEKKEQVSDFEIKAIIFIMCSDKVFKQDEINRQKNIEDTFNYVSESDIDDIFNLVKTNVTEE